MCGIAGYWNFNSNTRHSFEKNLENSISELDHRGPDDFGQWVSEDGIGLGHSRLSILDLSQSGHQPMFTKDKNHVLVFNGEIYNFREIRYILTEKGHEFSSDGDSEVVLASFVEWGVKCVDRFIGMFAFSIWDEVNRKMFLFRDRVGIKPLYYSWDNDALCFGSELKAIKSFTHWGRGIDKQALGEYFQYGYIAAPRTIYDKVKKLKPGCYLVFDEESKSPEEYRYWSVLNSNPEKNIDKTEEDLVDELEELLISACGYRMVSDVPVGVFLSGGIDSSLVAAILQKHSGEQIHTFTIGFDDKTCDESIWAAKVAEHIGTKHTEHILSLDEARNIIPVLPSLYDEPFQDSSAIPTLMVSKLAKEDVKVVLSSDGGDELFCGYNSYSLNPGRLKSIIKRPLIMRWVTKKVLKVIPDGVIAKALTWFPLFRVEKLSHVIRKIRKLRNVLPAPTEKDIFRASQSHWSDDEISQLIGETYTDPRLNINDYPGGYEEKMSLWDFDHYLPDDIMVKVDRATMGVSIEGREPLLDHRLIEFAYSLPLKYRIGELGPKHLLRKVLYKYVPREMIDRSKQGFAIPINRWVRADNGQLVNFMLNRNESKLHDYINTQMVKKEIQQMNKTGINETRVWQLYVFEKWLQECFE